MIDRMQRIIWLGFGLIVLSAVIYSGLSALMGEETIKAITVNLVKFIVYTVYYSLCIAIPLTGMWFVFTVIGGPASFIIERIQKFNEERADRAAKRKILEVQAATMLTDAFGRHLQAKHITVAGRSALAINAETGEQKWYAISSQVPEAEQDPEQGNPFADMDATDIFEHTYRKTVGKQNCPSLIIAGIKRSGKSTLMEWLSHRYADEADFTIFDPKQKDPLINWSKSVRLVGQDANYGEMLIEIERAEAQVTTMEPDKNRRKRFYVFDEWTNLMPAEYDGADIGLKLKRGDFGKRIFNFMLKVLTEWAYLGIGVIIMPHATEKTALGFPPGFGGLARNFNGALWFDYDEFSDTRACYFEFKGKRYEIPLWNPNITPTEHRMGQSVGRTDKKKAPKGPFPALSDSTTCTTPTILDPVWVQSEAEKKAVGRFYESKLEKAVCEAADNGAPSVRQICLQLNMSDNGRNAAKIKAVLDKYSIDVGS
jgi:hypothetical protein